MIECIFTLDYEIFGNGEGSLHEQVYKPAQELKGVFEEVAAKLVVFVEVAELQKIENSGADSAIDDVKHQLRELYQNGHEIALHLHPQWYNAKLQNGKWDLDYTEYNLCTLKPERIGFIVQKAIGYLGRIIGSPAFIPLSFRAGNWLLQPTATIAGILAQYGIKVDSSVFKGGVQHLHRLDYRLACGNGWHWRFSNDVNVPDIQGSLLELPIYTEMVPFWCMITGKRFGLQQKTRAAKSGGDAKGGPPWRVGRLRDYLRLQYPLKFDFCRMTLRELTAMVERVMRLDAMTPSVLKPLVAIGHTKDLMDLGTIEVFLNWLRQRDIPISTFASLYSRRLLESCPPIYAPQLHATPANCSHTSITRW